MPGGRSGSSANGGWREERVFDCEGKLIKQRGLFCHSERSEESSPGRPGRFLCHPICLSNMLLQRLCRVASTVTFLLGKVTTCPQCLLPPETLYLLRAGIALQAGSRGPDSSGSIHWLNPLSANGRNSSCWTAGLKHLPVTRI